MPSGIIGVREHWTIQDYVDRLMQLSEMEDALHPDIVERAVGTLHREVTIRFSREELFLAGIGYQKNS